MAPKLISIHHRIAYTNIIETHPEYWITVRNNSNIRRFKKGQKVKGREVALYVYDASKNNRYLLSPSSDLTYHTTGNIVAVSGNVLGFRRT